MSRALTIEMLYPEIANLHGDNANITYLAQCRPDARVIRTGLTDSPAFATGPVDLVYLGALTEQGPAQGHRTAEAAPGADRVADRGRHRVPVHPQRARGALARASATTTCTTTCPALASSVWSPRCGCSGGTTAR
ncbi:MAG: hypothetical protein WDM88_04265 [Galbitalea sp.]